MSRIESILQQVSIDGLIEEAYEIHEMRLKVSQLLLILQQDRKMTPLAKRTKFTTPKYTGTVQSIVW
ncbi:hypothetical protein ACT7DZ_15695 [Bacillus cereus]